MPQTQTEVTFKGEWAHLLVEDGEQDKIIIFSTIENLHTLAAATDIYIDKTFHTCPQLFYQIFTIHAMKFSPQFPLAYCLLPNKTQEKYEAEESRGKSSPKRFWNIGGI